MLISVLSHPGGSGLCPQGGTVLCPPRRGRRTPPLRGAGCYSNAPFTWARWERNV
ncbi:hypothetical protein GCM10010319_54540 [Streptomyces blastmyceticus]|uniref:Uncharacterized protein n=1 Tax=Streptomyces blastmyceticus TaxID=68180 RepID=A0ABP3HFQ9_9ACTN